MNVERVLMDRTAHLPYQGRQWILVVVFDQRDLRRSAPRAGAPPRKRATLKYRGTCPVVGKPEYSGENRPLIPIHSVHQ